MNGKSFTEDAAVKATAVSIFKKMFEGYDFEYKDVIDEVFKTSENSGTLNRESKLEVILVNRLEKAIKKLNTVTEQECKDSILEVLKDRSKLSALAANKQVYDLLKKGVKVKTKKDGRYTDKKITLIDFNDPKNNEYFLASEFWVAGEYGSKRIDLLLFINGIPLVVMEFKRPRITVREAYEGNIRDYKDTIPQLFWYNAFILISNGTDSRLGTLSSDFEDYFYWKKVDSENETAQILLDKTLFGSCQPNHLLDIIENFILYESKRKLMAKYHQYIGVNNLIDAFVNRKKLNGKLGVYWHTQRAGKTNSMICFAQKVLWKYPGNYTFLFVSDREELGKQIYQDFTAVGAITEPETKAKDGEHLKRLLNEDHRMIFTLIQKFRTDKGEKYPLLSNRDDIIVITDEAHRTQYDSFAMNMRTALPNASYLGFTGTPLMLKGNEKTKAVFGDYVSVYNFKDAITDGVTVPLFYENRSDPLKLNNPKINEEMYAVIDDADLNQDEEKRLSKEFSKEYYLITREERLDSVARDIVEHYTSRGYSGKAMVLSIDRFTAVKMYDKVQKYWQQKLVQLKINLKQAQNSEKQQIKDKITEMVNTDMAVVISKSHGEIEDFDKQGLDIRPHRRRMEREELDLKFKDQNDPFKIVFLCHMWLTGFNARSLSTLYIDKPMKNHSLMQAISRPATAIPGKQRAFLVAYLDIFQPLKNSLALYAAPRTDKDGIFSLQEKEILIKELDKKVVEMNKYLKSIKIDYEKIIAAKQAEKLRLLFELRNTGISPILINDKTKFEFLKNAYYLIKLYDDCKPDNRLSQFVGYIALYEEIVCYIRALDPKIDVSKVISDLKEVLDKSIVVNETQAIYDSAKLVDLSNINLDKIKASFKKTTNNIEIERLKNTLSFKINNMVKLNSLRTDYLEKFQKLIDQYNIGTLNQDLFFNELLKFSKSISDEERRHVVEGLSEEELALFDKLKKPKLTNDDIKELKKCAKDLLHALKNDGLNAVDWRKKAQTRAKVRIEIDNLLDKELPKSYTPIDYQNICEIAFQHFFDNYYGEGQSVYSLSI